MNAIHSGFVLAAYAAAALVVIGIIAAVIVDYRAQLRALARLEQRSAKSLSGARSHFDPD